MQFHMISNQWGYIAKKSFNLLEIIHSSRSKNWQTRYHLDFRLSMTCMWEIDRLKGIKVNYHLWSTEIESFGK